MLWTCEIQGAQHNDFNAKNKFPSRQGQPGSARAQPAWQNNVHLVQHKVLKG